MEQARDKNRLGISGLRTLITVDGKEGGYLFSLPVYKRGPVPISIEDRRRNLAGFVHGSLVLGKMFETIITANKTPEGLDSYFFPPDAGPAVLPIYVYGARGASWADDGNGADPRRPSDSASRSRVDRIDFRARHHGNRCHIYQIVAA